MATVLKTIRFPEEILEEIDPLIKKENTNFTGFVISAIETHMRAVNFDGAMNKSGGSWKKQNHPELKNGVDKYIRKKRKGRG